MAIKIWIFATLLLAISQNVQGLVIELGDLSDSYNNLIIENSCTYFHNYSSFNETNCLINWYDPGEDAFENITGAWGPCFRKPIGSPPLKECNIVYYGAKLSFPTRVTVNGRVSGHGSIQVEHKNSMLDNPDKYVAVPDLEFKSDTPDDPDVADSTPKIGSFRPRENAHIFRFTVQVPDDDSFAIIDRIIVETDDEFMPTTTKPPPPEVIGEYVLDTFTDPAKAWWGSITCKFAEFVEDYENYKCPQVQEIVEDAKAKGTSAWWAPCGISACDFIFSSKSSTQRPSNITVEGVMMPASIISIWRRKTGLFAQYVFVTSFAIPEKTSSWTYDVPKDCSYDFYKVSLSTGSGPMVVDTLRVGMIDSGVGECIDDTTIPTTTTTTTSSPSTPSTPSSSGSTEGEGPASTVLGDASSSTMQTTTGGAAVLWPSVLVFMVSLVAAAFALSV